MNSLACFCALRRGLGLCFWPVGAVGHVSWQSSGKKSRCRAVSGRIEHRSSSLHDESDSSDPSERAFRIELVVGLTSLRPSLPLEYGDLLLFRCTKLVRRRSSCSWCVNRFGMLVGPARGLRRRSRIHRRRRTKCPGIRRACPLAGSSARRSFDRFETAVLLVLSFSWRFLSFSASLRSSPAMPSAPDFCNPSRP